MTDFEMLLDGLLLEIAAAMPGVVPNSGQQLADPRPSVVVNP